MRLNIHEVRRLIQEALLNAYDILGVPKGASEDQIKAAWKKLALQHHPDRNAGDPNAHGKMVDINNAKDRLLNPTNKFRFGAEFKGYEDPKAAKAHAAPPKAAPPPPQDGWNSSKRDERDAWWKKQPPPPASAGGTYNDQASAKKAQEEQRKSGFREPRYFEFVGGSSSKFWEISVSGNKLTKRWGRIGSAGQTTTEDYSANGMAVHVAQAQINDKRKKGYVEKPRPGRPPPPKAEQPYWAKPPSAGTYDRPKAEQPDWAKKPKADPANSVRTPGASKDTYRIYGRKNNRPVHTRYKGKAYGPGPTTNTRFNPGQDAKVTRDPDGKLKVKKLGFDHTQTWDPIDEARQIIDELVYEHLSRLAD